MHCPFSVGIHCPYSVGMQLLHMEIAHRYVALQVAVISAEIIGLLHTWCQSLGLDGSAHINDGNVLHLALCLAELHYPSMH